MPIHQSRGPRRRKAVRKAKLRGSLVTRGDRNEQGRRAGTPKMESWFSSIRLLSDAVVVDALGDLSSCATPAAEPTMFKTMQHSTRRLLPMRRVLARHRPVTANSSLWSLRGSEFEQRVAASFGEVILWSVVDAYAVSAQNGDGRPNARAEQPAHEVQLAVWLEHAPKNRCRFIGWNLDGVNRTATASRINYGRLAGRPKVSGPARRTVARLDIRVSIEVQHCDRRCALNTRPAPAHHQEDVRCTRRHPGGDHPAGERVD
jgi:hypothetical protein